MPDTVSDAFYILNADSPSALILTVDHASRHIPAEYDNLGLTDPTVLARHIAWDIGIEDVSKRLSEKLEASAIFACFSRLLVDANRYTDDPASMPEVSDGIEIPANRNVSTAERQRRLDQWFWPYQTALEGLIEKKAAAHDHPILISMHSFTPVMNEFERPWHIGVLWDQDARIAAPLLDILRENSSLVVGDNEPYSAREPLGYTMNEHGTKRGLPHVAIEIRQDLIDTHQGAEKWAAIMADALHKLQAGGALGR
tara:strand:- start:315 stop:1079 length:765 start_codon:yes stop_codon:yes gene_type:complete